MKKAHENPCLRRTPHNPAPLVTMPQFVYEAYGNEERTVTNNFGEVIGICFGKISIRKQTIVWFQVGKASEMLRRVAASVSLSGRGDKNMLPCRNARKNAP